jgi:hypothetical protein
MCYLYASVHRIFAHLYDENTAGYRLNFHDFVLKLTFLHLATPKI